MPKLHQILAVERDINQMTNRRITDGYQALQHTGALSGLIRTYRPRNDGDDVLPSERVNVQINATDVLDATKTEFERLFDLTATKDFGNLVAVADVVLKDGTVLLTGAPATYLLWLEKQLNDLHTIVSKLPVLDPAEEWEYSEDRRCYVTKPIETNRTKKVPKVLVKAAATDKHPAQTEVYHEDVVVGVWETTKFSGALPATHVKELTDRVFEVREAVKVARSKANETEVDQKAVSARLLDYVFGGG